ncbi:hypothetical protein Tfer_0869 [Thermincola ferriacetica]|uniref:Uncharacterized protein n=1 Tax=Thermincola ferriacetica TaxID=281456 RepID=A0A0L6W5D7_9FIRM|nr:hypothetical protein [Thermincola ferriacetica]KNZ70309.1 hypothetical protein Tfer_0869 [Thermincola ferriacetica]
MKKAFEWLFEPSNSFMFVFSVLMIGISVFLVITPHSAEPEMLGLFKKIIGCIAVVGTMVLILLVLSLMSYCGYGYRQKITNIKVVLTSVITTAICYAIISIKY